MSAERVLGDRGDASGRLSVKDAHATSPAWRGPLAWACVVVPLAIVLVLGCYWEPIVRDSWGHLWWHTQTDVSLYEFAKDTYLHNNPRIGQVITWLLITPGPWHVIITPLVELSLFYLLASLVLGRWPSIRRPDDALAFAMLAAMILWTCPLVGPMLFYRPFTGNYLYGLVLCLAFLAPYRFHLEQPLAARPWHLPVVALLGFAAGLANEHTGPTVAALCTLALVVVRVCNQPWPPWMLAGVVGLVLGGAALFFAPGQDLRYEGLATQQSLVERIVARGADNLDIVTQLLAYLRALLVWLAIGGVGYAIARQRVPRIAWILLLASLAITLTLLASPKQGPRLYLASVAFACAGVTAVVLPQLVMTWWTRALAWTLAAAMAGRIGIKLVAVYADVGPVARSRIEQILSAPDGATLTLPAYTQPRSRWFMGDDLVHMKWRRHAAELFGLAAIELVDAKGKPTGERPASAPDQRPATGPDDDDP